MKSDPAPAVTADERKELNFRQLAADHGDKPAVVMADGSAGLVFRDLDMRSDALARAMAGAGLRAGDQIAIMLPNGVGFLIAVAAAIRSGLAYTPLHHHLGMSEMLYVLRDCTPRLLLTDLARMPRSDAVPGLDIWVSCALDPAGFRPLSGKATKDADYADARGHSLLYSSGAGGRPRAVKFQPSYGAQRQLGTAERFLAQAFGIGGHTVFLITAPLYHIAPLNFALAVIAAGGTCVLMDVFDPQLALDLIGFHRVTAAWMVPDMFIRLLRLPMARRDEADTSSLTHVIHGAAPCPVEAKQAMMDWLGYVVHELYGATEGVGMVSISPGDWLAHPGSVGWSDRIRIIGEDGLELPPGEVGEIYFVDPPRAFTYFNDPEKTVNAFNRQGWATVGDMGHVDEEGWLYIADRKSHIIWSGGQRIFPQETESILAAHSQVADVAVIGVPHKDRGEEVRALVVPVDALRAGPQLERDLITWCAERLDGYKCPAVVEFVAALPRLPTGKMRKRELRERYRFVRP